MLIVLSISIFLFITYIATLIILFGIPASVSDSFYLFTAKKQGEGYFFTIWCYAVAITVMILMLEKSDGAWYQFLGLFAGSGLGFVGTAPMFKSHEKVIHYISASVCAVSSLLWIVFSGYWLIPSVMFCFAAVIIKRQYKKLMFWLEIACFLSLYLTLYWMIL